MWSKIQEARLHSRICDHGTVPPGVQGNHQGFLPWSSSRCFPHQMGQAVCRLCGCPAPTRRNCFLPMARSLSTPTPMYTWAAGCPQHRDKRAWSCRPLERQFLRTSDSCSGFFLLHPLGPHFPPSSSSRICRCRQHVQQALR